MKRKINNIDELKWEIARLKELNREQEVYLKDQYSLLKAKIDKPTRILGSLTSSIPGVGLVKDLMFSAGSKNTTEFNGKNDWVNKAIRIGVPLLLNRTVLRKSSWLKKSLVLLASETAAGNVTKEGITDVISKVAQFIRPKKKVSKKKEKHLQENVDDSPEDQILGI